jgi:mobilome CxxCx(11)CxxC protein
MRTPDTDRICGESWKLAIYAYGTAIIFQKRSRRYRGLIRALTYIGIVVPLLIGGVVLGFGLHASFLPTLLWVAAAAGVFQLGFSAWSLVFTWADDLEYSLESATENFDISSRFKDLGSLATVPPADVATAFAIVKAKDDARRAADSKKGVTEKELRYGHRAALRQFERECTGCHKVPTSMDSTDCPICGRF